MDPLSTDNAPAARCGRDSATGRFTKGWRGGKGNPLAGKVAKLRAALINTVTEKDMRDVVHALIKEAKSGDVTAARELLDRLIGKPVEIDLLVRLEELEQMAQKESL